jgi:thiamine-monophosphate kinase
MVILNTQSRQMQSALLDKEMSLVKTIAEAFPRHPQQKNQLFESDAEVIDFKNKLFRYLVLKTDGIYEEIREKLYEDPYIIGWMAVTVTMSDLAATGASPIGLLMSLQLSKENDAGWLRQFQKGIHEACEQYYVYVLGGDTNFDSALSVSTTGVGTIQHGEPMSRKGIRAGELLYSTGRLGLGNAFAYGHYFDPRIRITYKPLARLKESILIREFATSCIDTSDGLFPALSVLSALNDVGFEFASDTRDILQNDVNNVAVSAEIPSWMLLAGPHGEYELLFTIPSERRNEFEKRYQLENGLPVYIGHATSNRKLHFTSEAMQVSCDPSLIANLFHEANRDAPRYFELLKQQQQKWMTV